tara:strand:- start:687 stop:1745 length:1059 start_codon:yes stop_codon:yes gene_type:complete
MSNINYKDESEKYHEKYDEYHRKFWKSHHENKILLKEIEKLHKHIDILANNLLYGKIKSISNHCDWGLINHDKYGDIFFHRTKCNFQLSNQLLDKRVRFNITITKKLEAYNVEIILDSDNISSAYDLLNYGINYSSDSSSESSSDSSSESEVSTDYDSLSESGLIENNSNGSINDGSINDESINDGSEIIDKSSDIWYMNARGGAWDNFELFVENKFMYTWNNKGRNNKLYKNIKKGDIIVWYIVKRGYIAITEVTGDCINFNNNDKFILKGKNQQDYESHMEWEKTADCVFIKIPVRFLSYQDKNECIKYLENWPHDEWTIGLRGSSAMKPTKEGWKRQVLDMYKEMKFKD